MLGNCSTTGVCWRFLAQNHCSRRCPCFYLVNHKNVSLIALTTPLLSPPLPSSPPSPRLPSIPPDAAGVGVQLILCIRLPSSRRARDSLRVRLAWSGSKVINASRIVCRRGCLPVRSIGLSAGHQAVHTHRMDHDLSDLSVYCRSSRP